MLRFEAFIVCLCISMSVCELVKPDSRQKEKVEYEMEANSEFFRDLEAAENFAKTIKKGVYDVSSAKRARELFDKTAKKLQRSTPDLEARHGQVMQATDARLATDLPARRLTWAHNFTKGVDLDIDKAFESNNTNIYQDETPIYEDLNSYEINVLWLFGIGTSALSLIFQIYLYITLPKSRAVDQMILTQMTVARLINVLFEYFMIHPDLISNNVIIKDAVFSIYQQTDAALTCFIFVFTKNLYDKNIFNNFILISVLTWVFTLPIGLLCPISLEFDVFDTFYGIYIIIKFIVVAVNFLLFCRIIRRWIAINNERADGKHFLKILVIGLILVAKSSVQVFVTGLITFYLEKYQRVLIAFCIINSYEALVMTALFIISLGNITSSVQSLTETSRFYNNIDMRPLII